MRPLDYFDEPAYEPIGCAARLTDSHSGAIGDDGLCQSCHADVVWDKTGGPVTLGYQACDHCVSVSQLYQPFPTCRSCAESVCQACAVPGSLHETDGESAETVLCLKCQEAR